MTYASCQGQATGAARASNLYVPPDQFVWRSGQDSVGRFDLPTLDDLLVPTAGEPVSGLQKIKANPSKPSAQAMLPLTDKLAAIASAAVLAFDLPRSHIFAYSPAAGAISSQCGDMETTPRARPGPTSEKLLMPASCSTTSNEPPSCTAKSTL